MDRLLFILPISAALFSTFMLYSFVYFYIYGFGDYDMVQVVTFLHSTLPVFCPHQMFEVAPTVEMVNLIFFGLMV